MVNPPRISIGAVVFLTWANICEPMPAALFTLGMKESQFSARWSFHTCLLLVCPNGTGEIQFSFKHSWVSGRSWVVGDHFAQASLRWDSERGNEPVNYTTCEGYPGDWLWHLWWEGWLSLRREVTLSSWHKMNFSAFVLFVWTASRLLWW